MYWRPRAFMATTPPFQSRRKANAQQDAYGHTFATIGPSGGSRHWRIFYASTDRRGKHPQDHLAKFDGILQADCYSGYNLLFDRTTEPGPVTPAFCFAHARRKFFELADVSRSTRRGKSLRPVSATALEAVKRIDALFDIEPINYMLSRWADFARYADDGRICVTNNAAERALRGVACGRKNWNFAGSQRGADRPAIMLTLITRARLNDVDPKVWLADVLTRIADLPITHLHELLPWNWKPIRNKAIAAAA